MFRLAHVSDLHVLSPAGAEWRAMLFNKRLTGHANLWLQRGRAYRRELLRAVLDASADADHVVVTGDITNLALESEYEAARELLDELARRVEVTVVPGNHDIYLPAIHRTRRFVHHFGHFLRSDLPRQANEQAHGQAAGAGPCVKLRGPLALIALSSAVPRPPFVSAGYLGGEQIEALQALLAHPEVARRLPVLLLHHPPVDGRPWLLRMRDGLVDAARLRRALAGLARGLVLYGHTHRRVRCRLRTAAGVLDVVSASGAALEHHSDAVRAGCNRYEFDADGRLVGLSARVVDAAGAGWRDVDIARRESCL